MSIEPTTGETGGDANIGRMVAMLLELEQRPRKLLAAQMGISPQALSQKIHGTSPWKSREVIAVARLLSVPVALLYRDPEAVLDELRQPFVNYRSSA